MTLPPLLPKKPRRSSRVRCEAHLRWIRKHACSVPGCDGIPIQAAHVRSSRDGGLGQKPGDQWTISLCARHHREQHQRGEHMFEEKHGIDMYSLAEEFANHPDSPWRRKFGGK